MNAAKRGIKWGTMKKLTFFISVIILMYSANSIFGIKPLFNAWKSYDVDRLQDAICVSDFDNDGNYDLVVTHYAHLRISILINNGDGAFQEYIKIQ